MLQRDHLLYERNNKTRQRRDCVQQIVDFINSDRCCNGKIMVVYGLRRTGKTVAMEQALIDCAFAPDDCMFFEIRPGDMTRDVEKVIIENPDKKVFVFDEFTILGDYIDLAASLPDVFATAGHRIIISGTDSLGLLLAENDTLFDRTERVETTYIPFAEHARVTGSDSIDDYIKHGGLMSKSLSDSRDFFSAKKYLDRAVAGNIARSIKAGYGAGWHYSSLEKVSEKDIACAIEKIVEKYSGEIDVKSVRDELTKVSLSEIPHKAKLFGISDKEFITRLIGSREDIVRDFVPLIGADKRITSPVTTEMVSELIDALRNLQVLSSVEEVVFNNTGGRWDAFPPRELYYIVQPAIKYHHLKAAVKFVLEDPRGYYSAMSPSSKNKVQKFLEATILGQMTEQIALYDTKTSLSHKDYYVCKPVFQKEGRNIGEYDMLIYNRRENTYLSFEIKHGSTAYPTPAGDIQGENGFHDRHLLNPFIREIADTHFGKSSGDYVLYGGDPFISENEITYLNHADFLRSLHETRNAEVTIAKLAQEIPEILQGRADGFDR